MTNQTEPPIPVTLLPCPFCANDAVVNYDAGAYTAECSGPMCSCPVVSYVTMDSEAEAIAAWNTRAHPTPESSLNELLGLRNEISDTALRRAFLYVNSKLHDTPGCNELMTLRRLLLAERDAREPVSVDLEQNADSIQQTQKQLIKRLKTAIGGLRSIAYGHVTTWPGESPRQVAKQTLLDCGGEKHVD